MWRPAHGATTRPGPSRPASGYGRAVGRPGPASRDRGDDDPTGETTLEPSMFGASPAPVESDADAPAITP